MDWRLCYFQIGKGCGCLTLPVIILCTVFVPLFVFGHSTDASLESDLFFLFLLPPYLAIVWTGQWAEVRPSSRALWILPVSWSDRARTVWIGMVLFPAVLVFLYLAFLGFLFSETNGEFWVLARFLFQSTCLSILISAAVFYHWRKMAADFQRRRVGIDLIFWLYVVLVGAATAFWRDSGGVRLLVIITAVPVLALGYLYAPRLRGERGFVSVRPAEISAALLGRENAVYGSTTTAGPRERLLSRPAGQVFAHSLILTGLCWIAVAGFHFIPGDSEKRGAYDSVMTDNPILFYLAGCFIVFWMLMPWLRSMRAFAGLPLSRRRRVWNCILLAACATTPPFLLLFVPIQRIAAQDAFRPDLIPGQWLIALGMVLIAQGFILRGNPLGGLHFEDKEEVDLSGCVTALGLVAAAAMLVILFVVLYENVLRHSGIATLLGGLFLTTTGWLWIRELLYCKNEPYRAPVGERDEPDWFRRKA